MNVKLLDLINSRETLIKLGNTTFDDGLTMFEFMRNINGINKELNNFEEVRTALIKKYGKETEKGVWEVMPSNKQEFTKEIDAIVNKEIEIDILLLKPEKIAGITPFEMMTIEWMLEEKPG